MAVLLLSQHRVAAGERFEHWLTWWNGESKGGPSPGWHAPAAYEGLPSGPCSRPGPTTPPPALRCPCSKGAGCSAPGPAAPLHAFGTVAREGYWRPPEEWPVGGQVRGERDAMLDDGDDGEPLGLRRYPERS